MQESGEDFGEQDEDTEIQNLVLDTEHKADGIYRYWRRAPKTLVERVGKGTYTVIKDASKRTWLGTGPKHTPM